MAALTGSGTWVSREEVLSRREISGLRPRGRAFPG